MYSTFNYTQIPTSLNITYQSSTIITTPATSNTPLTNSTTQTPVTNSTTQAPLTNSTTQTPVTNSATQTPVTDSTTQTPVTNSTTQTPVTNSTTQTPVTISTTQTPSMSPTTAAPTTTATSKPPLTDSTTQTSPYYSTTTTETTSTGLPSASPTTTVQVTTEAVSKQLQKEIESMSNKTNSSQFRDIAKRVTDTFKSITENETEKLSEAFNNMTAKLLEENHSEDEYIGFLTGLSEVNEALETKSPTLNLMPTMLKASTGIMKSKEPGSNFNITLKGVEFVVKKTEENDFDAFYLETKSGSLNIPKEIQETQPGSIITFVGYTDDVKFHGLEDALLSSSAVISIQTNDGEDIKIDDDDVKYKLSLKCEQVKLQKQSSFKPDKTSGKYPFKVKLNRIGLTLVEILKESSIEIWGKINEVPTKNNYHFYYSSLSGQQEPKKVINLQGIDVKQSEEKLHVTVTDQAEGSEICLVVSTGQATDGSIQKRSIPRNLQTKIVSFTPHVYDDGRKNKKPNNDIKTKALETNYNLVLESNLFGTFTSVIEIITPGKLDFDEIFFNLDEKILENPFILAVLLVIFIIYCVLAIFVRHLDKHDRVNWEFLPLVDNVAKDKYLYLLRVYTGIQSPRSFTATPYFLLKGKSGKTDIRILKDGVRKVVFTAMLLSFIFKSPATEEDKYAAALSSDRFKDLSQFPVVPKESLKICPMPNLASEDWQKKKEILQLDYKLFNMFQSLFFRCLYIVLLVILIANESKDGIESMWDWIEKYAVPGIFPLTDSNGKELKLYDQYFLPDKTNRRLGGIRLRQIRMVKVPCHMSKLVKMCIPNYSAEHEDTKDYLPGWKIGAKQKEDEKYITAAFKYTSEEKAGYSFTNYGVQGNYESAGYMIDINERHKKAKSLFKTLRSNTWIDERTRAVIIDISTYNANSGLFTSTKIMIERLSCGRMEPSIRSLSFKFHPFVDPLDYLVFLIIIIVGILCLITLVGVVIAIKKRRMQALREYHTLMNMATVISIVVIQIGFGLRIDALLQIQGKLVKNPERYLPMRMNSQITKKVFQKFDLLVCESISDFEEISWMLLTKYINCYLNMHLRKPGFESFQTKLHGAGDAMKLFQPVFTDMCQIGNQLEVKKINNGGASWTLW
ncbi:Hypothetical predicted protein [Octopus vulgaris]|uniref:Polycystin domain-containing protein n=1 Tax=Octopus vulgaris TaxID=6645 RepID=A0AA36BC79_OCTVU|nr:Hypothetical predicted protein [Octopus vulgaris]